MTLVVKIAIIMLGVAILGYIISSIKNGDSVVDILIGLFFLLLIFVGIIVGILVFKFVVSTLFTIFINSISASDLIIILILLLIGMLSIIF